MNLEVDKQAVLKLSAVQLKLLKKSLKHEAKRQNQHDRTSLDFLSLDLMIEDAQQQLADDQLQSRQYQYEFKVRNVEDSFVLRTRNPAFANQLKFLFQVSKYGQTNQLDMVEFGNQLAWLTKTISDNQSYNNHDNWVGTTDDWLLNFDTTWEALTEVHAKRYPHVHCLFYLIDFIFDVAQTYHGTLDMHDPKIDDTQYYRVLDAIANSSLRYHFNETTNQVLATKSKVKKHKE